MFDLPVNLSVGVQNALWATGSWSVALLFGCFLYCSWRRGEPLSILAMGVFVVTLNTGIHRVWWWAWRWALSHDFDGLAGWLKSEAWLLWLPLLGILVGYGFHQYHQLKIMFGRWWWVPVLGLNAFALGVTVLTFGPH